MKNRLFFYVLIILCLVFATASAAPVITDETTTGWIADHDYLYLRNDTGAVLQLPMAIGDLLGITEEEIICQTRDQRVVAVKKDGSGSRIVDYADAEAMQDQRLKMQDGMLYLNGAMVSSTATAAVTDGIFLYTVEKGNQSFILRVSTIQEGGKLIVPGSREAYASALTNRAVSEPLNLTVTLDALTLTGTDHRVTVMDLTNGEINQYPAASEMTAAACMMNGILYRYLQSEDLQWSLESTETVSMPKPTASPTPNPTSSPTPSPKPTPTPSPKPSPTPQSLIDDDGTVHRGASGDTVRKIQKRLKELGYPVGKVDGIYGEQTQLAINLFCNAIHVREHNYIPPSVQRKLNAKDAPEYDRYLPLNKGDRGVSVLYMQKRLQQLGYDPGKLDGIYGEMTVTAVALFQTDYDISLSAKETPGEHASRAMLKLLYSSDLPPVSAYQEAPEGEKEEKKK